MKWQDECKVDIIYQQTGTTQRPGGQQAGMPAHAIRVTHLPTGIMAQGEFGYRSQFKSREITFTMVEWGLIEFGYIKKDTT